MVHTQYTVKDLRLKKMSEFCEQFIMFKCWPYLMQNRKKIREISRNIFDFYESISQF